MSDDIWRNDDEPSPDAGGRRPGRFEAIDGRIRRRGVRWAAVRRRLPVASRRRRSPMQPPRRTGRGLSFGDDSTGPLPHWTEPPTGEMPQDRGRAGGADPSRRPRRVVDVHVRVAGVEGGRQRRRAVGHARRRRRDAAGLGLAVRSDRRTELGERTARRRAACGRRRERCPVDHGDRCRDRRRAAA